MSHRITHFRNGTVFDGHRYIGATEVLVGAGRILQLGSPGSLQPDPTATDVVDLAGGLLLPGFTDAHIHAVQGGLERNRCDLTRGQTRDDYRRLIAAYARSNPDQPWVLGGGWSMPAFPGGTPLLTDVDDLVPDRPLFLPNRDHHSAWVNSAALGLAGVDRHTPDPPDGRVERDSDGNPTGTLHEGAMKLVSRLVPAPTDAEYYRAFQVAQDHLHSLGITGWQEAIVGAYSGMEDPGPTYRLASQRGELTGRVVGALWWGRGRGLEQLPELQQQRADYSTDRFRATSVKIMQDGVAENFSAALLAPYLDRCGHPTDNAGHSFFTAVELREAVSALDAAGFQVHVHAIGDRGVREALDAFVGTDPINRHHIAHLQLVHPDDIERFAELGVTANLQMLWACEDDQMRDLTIPFIGADRAGWQYPFAGLQRAGAQLAAGSDWPISSANPLEAIHVGVNRAEYDASSPPGPAFLPEQRLSLEVALAAYTSGSARLNQQADQPGATGVIAPGALADLVVLDRDPFTAPDDEIAAATVTSTWIDGLPVYQR